MKQNKTALLRAGVFVFALVCGYLLTAFVTWEFSPKEWGGAVRGFASLMTVSVAALFTFAPFDF